MNRLKLLLCSLVTLMIVLHVVQSQFPCGSFGDVPCADRMPELYCDRYQRKCQCRSEYTQREYWEHRGSLTIYHLDCTRPTIHISKTALIVGVAIGVLALTGGAIVGVIFMMRRRRMGPFV